MESSPFWNVACRCALRLSSVIHVPSSWSTTSLPKRLEDMADVLSDLVSVDLLLRLCPHRPAVWEGLMRPALPPGSNAIQAPAKTPTLDTRISSKYSSMLHSSMHAVKASVAQGYRHQLYEQLWAAGCQPLLRALRFAQHNMF
jgi:hypothetical protein